jgi:hypothetical protein
MSSKRVPAMAKAESRPNVGQPAVTLAGGLVSISELAGTLRARGMLSGPSSRGCEASRYAFEQPKRLHVILNMRVAHAPGLTVSPLLLGAC